MFKNLFQIFKSFIFLFAVIFFVLSCKKGSTESDNNGNREVTPLISSVLPTSGGFSTVVTIKGNNFSKIPTENIVKFNGVVAVVLTSSINELTVVVPSRAGSGPISVKVGYSVEALFSSFTYNLTPIVSTVRGASGPILFTFPTDVSVDNAENIYIANSIAHQVMKISSTGFVSILAGSSSRNPGFIDGQGTAARLNNPWAVQSDPNGVVYVCDMYNHALRKISLTGQVTTIAGNGVPGNTNGIGAAAQFNYPDGITIDRNLNLYVSDRDGGKVRKITQAGVVTSQVSTALVQPHGLAMDSSGFIWVADPYLQMLVKSKDAFWVQYGTLLNGGFENGTLANARYLSPQDVAIDSYGNLYVADAGNHRIRKITPSGIVSTLAGSGISGFTDGPGNIATFDSPTGVAVAANGTVYVADLGNKCIRKITME